MKLYALLLCIPLLGANARWVPYEEDEERVVGGTDAKPGEIPYIVSLRVYGSHICGGSIVDEWHVLTAAHCTDGSNSFTIQYGITKISSTGNVITVAKKFQHKQYNPQTIKNDVSILRLSQPIPLGENVKSVTLPAQGEAPPANQWGVLAGWGYSRTGGGVMLNLQRVDLVVYSDEACAAAHGSRVDSFSNVCGGVPEGGKGQCSGDSGGPLVANGKQWGVVSWSVKPCTVKGYPGVYARVSSYVDWINIQIQS